MELIFSMKVYTMIYVNLFLSVIIEKYFLFLFVSLSDHYHQQQKQQNKKINNM